MGKIMKKKTGRKIISITVALVMFLSVPDVFTPVTLKAQTGNVISISTAEQLNSIGKDADYPLDGDYVLTEDIDMSGAYFTPIGGIEGERGAVSGNNIFSGTFDGQGHLISGFTIDTAQTVTQNMTAEIGMFSNIASSDPSDYAEVKNIVFADVYIKADMTGGFTSAGVLAGDVSGYASVSNIAVLSGELLINGSNKSDVIGAGGIIGEIRTAGSMGNGNIRINDLYNAAEIISGSSTDFNYVGGIIGRVSKSECKSITRCVNTGRTSFKGNPGAGIANFNEADSKCLSYGYFLFDTGQTSTYSTEMTESSMKGGTLPEGLDSLYWYSDKGMYPLPVICKNPGPSGYLALSELSPVYADGENAGHVTKNFTLPLKAGNISITWESSNTEVIEINGAVAVVKKVMSPVRVILTASADGGITRKYMVTVVSDAKARFEQNYAKPDVPLTVTVDNAPDGINLTCQWKVNGVVVSTENSYTPKKSDLEKFITVTIKASDYNVSWELSMYCSELPVVYVDTADSMPVTDKNKYKDANFKLQGNDEFPDSSEYYDGLAEIKGRGNSTWDFASINGLKKPYKIKLDKKADILGMGKNKHWVLLANLIDHTNMRNQLASEFSHDIGMEVYMQSTDVVLILNGEYQGVYQLSEHKRIDEERVNVYDWENLGEDIADAIVQKEGMSEVKDEFEDALKEDLSWYDTGYAKFGGKSYKVSDYYKGTIPEFTGGFLLDMDFRLDMDSKFISKLRTDYYQPLFFDTPEYAVTSNKMMNYTRNYVQAFENALHSDDFYAEYNGTRVHYSELFDIESLLQNWMVVEYSMNWDGMKNSTLMYKDLDGKMKMGPVWDFDWAFGNMNMYSNNNVWKYNKWHTTEESFIEARPQQEQQWNRYLIKDPYFALLAYEMWQKIRPTYVEDMIKDYGKIDTLAAKYRSASLANDAKWRYSYSMYGGTGVTNGIEQPWKTSEEFDAAVNTMKYFIKHRVDWFDTQFTSPEKLLESWGSYVGSNHIFISDIDMVSVKNSTIFTAAVSNSDIAKIGFYVNGILQGISDVVSSKASLAVNDSALREGQQAGNVIQVRAMDRNGNLLKSSSNVITNYKIFYKDVVRTIEGNVEIQGKPAVGRTLRAVTDITDVNLSWQWLANGIEIAGANESSYIVRSEDIGKKISVAVTSDEKEGRIESKETGAVFTASYADHVIINQVYGGGNAGDTPLSHSFIELYNPTEHDIDITGWKIGYLSNRTGKDGGTGGEIVQIQLAGIIPAYTSYLIRCAEEQAAASAGIINNCDMQWDQVIDNKQYQVILYNNGKAEDAVSVDEESVEGVPVTGISKQKAIRRIEFVDIDDNEGDFEIVAYNSITEEDYDKMKPRSTADGVWGLKEPEPEPTPTPSPENKPTPTPQPEDRPTPTPQPGTKPDASPGITAAPPTTADAADEPLSIPPVADAQGIPSVDNPSFNPSVKLNVRSAKMQVGQKAKVFKIIKRNPDTDRVLRWTSSNKRIVSVNQKGLVTAKKTGKAVITVTMMSGAAANIKITVQKRPVATKKLALTKKKVTIKKGRRYRLAVNRKPVTANDALVFKSSNTGVARVDSKGVISGRKKGNAVINIICINGKRTGIKVVVR